MSYIEVKHLTKVLKKKIILNDVSFQIEKGTISGFVGHNGSGKTMLLRALAGFLKVPKKAVMISGKEVNFNVPYPVSLGVIIETPEFIGGYTGLENLKYLAQINEKITTDQILLALEEVELIYAKDQNVREYSLGMKQRLGICQAFMEGQELLLLDEPTNGLDRVANELFVHLAKKWKKEGRTVIIATHDKLLVDELADHVFQITDGCLE